MNEFWNLHIEYYTAEKRMNFWYPNNVGESQKHYIGSKKPETKASIVCNLFIWDSKTGKTNLCDGSQNSGYLGVGKWFLAMRWSQEFSLVMEMLYTFVWMVLTQGYWYMKIHWTIHLIIYRCSTWNFWLADHVDLKVSLVDKDVSGKPQWVNHGTGHRHSASRLSISSRRQYTFLNTIPHILLRLGRDYS